MIQAISSKRGLCRLLALCLCLVICISFVWQIKVQALAAEASLVMMGLYLLVAFGVITIAQAQAMQAQFTMHDFIEEYDYEAFLAGIASTIAPNNGTVFSLKVAEKIVMLSLEAWVELKQFISDFKVFIDNVLTPGLDGSYGIDVIEGATVLTVDTSIGENGCFYLNSFRVLIDASENYVLNNSLYSEAWTGFQPMQLNIIDGVTDEYIYCSYTSNTYCLKYADGTKLGNVYGVTLNSNLHIAISYNTGSGKLYALTGYNGYLWRYDISSKFPNTLTIIQSLLEGVDLTVDESENSIGGNNTYYPVFPGIDIPGWVNIPTAVDDWFNDKDNLPVAIPDDIVDVISGLDDVYPIPDGTILPGIDVAPDFALPDAVTDKAGDIVGDAGIADAIPDIADDVGNINDALTGEQALDFSGYDGLGAALTAVFPFCIPWDIKHCVEQFQAQGDAPDWTFNLGTSIGQNVPIEIDLSDFDNVAIVLRSLFLILFIIGLIILTSKVIRW